MCEYIILEDFKMDKYIYDENNGLWYEPVSYTHLGSCMKQFEVGEKAKRPK